MISDSEYTQWLNRTRDKRPVVLVDIETDDSAVILRASTARYQLPSAPYISALLDYETVWNMTPGTNGQSYIRDGELVLANLDGQLDDWFDKTYTTVTIRYGDQSWLFGDFRTQFIGQVTKPKGNRYELVLEIRDSQHDLTIEHDAADFGSVVGLPGSIAKTILQNPGPYALSDLDEAAFDQLDIDYPWACTVTVSERSTVQSVLDKLFNGMPIDYGPDRSGKITVFEVKTITNSSNHRKIRPLSDPSITWIPPLGEVTVKRGSSYEATVTRQAILDAWPSARRVSVETAVDTKTNAEALANKGLDLDSIALHRIEVPTRDNIAGINLGDEVEIDWPRLGYENGRFGIVTGLLASHQSDHELTVRVAA